MKYSQRAFLVMMAMILTVVFISQAECGQALDSKQITVNAVVNTFFHSGITPSIMELHEVGHKILLSKGSVTVSVASNTPFTLYFKTANPDGNIRNDLSYLETFYIILPSGSPPPSVNDPRWMSGAVLNSYTVTSDAYNTYKRDIYVKAIKDAPPYRKKEYTDTVTITTKDQNGSESIMQFQVVYRLW